MGVVSILGGRVIIMRDGELVGDAPVACRHGIAEDRWSACVYLLLC